MARKAASKAKWAARDGWGDVIVGPDEQPLEFRADTAGEAAIAAVRALVERGVCGESTTVDVRMEYQNRWFRVRVDVKWTTLLNVRTVAPAPVAPKEPA